MSEIAFPFFLETTTPLAANAVYTGPARDVRIMPQSGSVQSGVTYFKQINAVIFSDVASTSSGMSFQLSYDMITWTPASTSLVAANNPSSATRTITAPFYRIVYTNGPVAQTIFNITVSLTI